jgi:hypothetical protein
MNTGIEKFVLNVLYVPEFEKTLSCPLCVTPCCCSGICVDMRATRSRQRMHKSLCNTSPLELRRAGQNEILQSFPFIPFRHIFFHSFSFHSIPATSSARACFSLQKRAAQVALGPTSGEIFQSRRQQLKSLVRPLPHQQGPTKLPLRLDAPTAACTASRDCSTTWRLHWLRGEADCAMRSTRLRQCETSASEAEVARARHRQRPRHRQRAAFECHRFHQTMRPSAHRHARANELAPVVR